LKRISATAHLKLFCNYAAILAKLGTSTTQTHKYFEHIFTFNRDQNMMLNCRSVRLYIIIS